MSVAPPVDAAIVVVPAPAVTGVIEECIDQGVKVATVVSSGFGELHGDARARDRADQLRALIDRSGLRVLGPNTTGVVNVLDAYVPRASANLGAQLRTGGITVLTQSGAMNNAVINSLADHGGGICYGIAAGNQSDLTVEALLAALAGDRDISTFLLVVEELADPDVLVEAVERCHDAGQRVALLPVGRSAVGAATTQRHSGSTANLDRALEARVTDAGVFVVEDLWELVRIGLILDREPPIPGRRLGVIAMSGGEAGLLADVADSLGFVLPSPSTSTIQTLDEVLSLTSIENPLDTTGEVLHDPDRFRRCVEAFAADPEFEILLVALPSLGDVDAGRVLPAIRAAAEGRARPVIVTTWTHEGLTPLIADEVRTGTLTIGDDAGSWLRALRRAASVS